MISLCFKMRYVSYRQTLLRHDRKMIYKKKALILIDIQNGLTKKKNLFNKEVFLDSVNFSIRRFRDQGLKIIFAQHSNKFLQNGTFDWEIDDRIDKQKNDTIIQKYHGNAFQETQLKQLLLDFKIGAITVGGLVSHGCVKATCLGGLSEGFKTLLLKKGHTNWNKDSESIISKVENELLVKGVFLDE